MSVKELTLETIGQIDDGRVALAFQAELKRIITDCQDRPGDNAARSLILTLKVVPIIDEAGFCEEVNGEFQVKSSVPNRKSKTYSFGVRKGGITTFSSTSPTSVKQKTIVDGDDE